MLLGVSTWVLCRSRLSFLRFCRDWLDPLVDFGRDDERLDAFLHALDAIGNGLGRLAPRLDGAPKPAARRKMKSAQPTGAKYSASG
jgi:hypothetical protein